MCISDPTTDKAAVSLSVGIGHLNDPVSQLQVLHSSSPH